MSGDTYTYHLDERSLTQRWLTQRLWEPIARRLPARLHPNAITAVGALSMLASLACAWQALAGLRWGYLCAALCAALYFIADNVDGPHARSSGQTSRLGEFLDHWLDAINGAALTLPVALCLGLRGGLLLAVAASVALVYFVTIWEQHHTGTFHSGRLGSNEAILAGIGLYLLLYAFPAAPWLRHTPGAPTLAAGMALLTVAGSTITALGVLRRCRGRAPLSELLPLVLAVAALGALALGGLLDEMIAVAWIMALNVLLSGGLLIGRLTRRQARCRGAVVATTALAALLLGVARPAPLDAALDRPEILVAASAALLLALGWDLVRTARILSAGTARRGA
jgi:phosphatidylglycerophosphate synthase